MYEIDFIPVGDGDRSGLAIAMRFTRADTGGLAHVVIDGGFQDDGADLVDLIQTHYGTSQVDAVILTHPDGDHIGGLGTVIRELDVQYLFAHRPSQHGGASLRASGAVEDLVNVAAANGTEVHEPFSGLNLFDGGLIIAGPDRDYYGWLIQEQLKEEGAKAAAAAGPSRLTEALQKMSAQVMGALPVEVPFDDGGGTNPRNNSSAIVNVRTGDDRRLVFTGDAGVPAFNEALDYLDNWGRTDRYPDFVQIPHHGSRKNASSELLDRMLGPKGGAQEGSAFISISAEAAKDPRYPSPRVCNAYRRRGYGVYATAGIALRHGHEAPYRHGYGPVEPLPPLDESIDDR